MKREAKEVFSIKMDDVYNDLQAKVHASPSLRYITATSSSLDLEKISSDILSSLFAKKIFKMDPEPVSKNLTHEIVSVDEGSDLIGNGFKFTMASNEVTVSHLQYAFECEGDFSSLDYSVKYSKREVPISFQSNQLFLHFYFQGEPKDAAAHIQQQKNNYINLITTNQKEVEEFYSLKQDSFLRYIRQVVESKSVDMKKLSADTDLF